MKKNDEFIGVCSGLTENGLGVVRHEGFCFFVKDALVDEEVLVHVTSVKKNYGYGFVKKHLKVSSNRIEPKCGVYKQCGGCQLQHLSYKGQLEYKKQRVMDCFSRIAHMDVPVLDCLGMDDPWKYRNKVQVPVEKTEEEIKVGFYRINSHDIIDYTNCNVQSDVQNQIVHFIKNTMIQLNCGDEIRHLLIKHAHRTNQVMLVLIVRKFPFKGWEKLVEACVKQFSEIQSVLVNINNREDNVILGNEEKVVYGESRIQENLSGRMFNISSKSFYQINPYQTEVLYQKAIDLAEITKDDTVADVCCGTGTIGIFAARYAKKVIGIEIVPSAVEDAKINAAINHVDNIEFILGDAAVCTAELAKKNTKIDAAIVDPPRKGLDERTIDALCIMKPSRIVYVSCDPATLARDCVRFKERGYIVDLVQPVDMFPHTCHVENIVLLNRE